MKMNKMNEICNNNNKKFNAAHRSTTKSLLSIQQYIIEIE